MIDHDSGHDLALQQRFPQPHLDRFQPAIELLPSDLKTLALAVLRRVTGQDIDDEIDEEEKDELGKLKPIFHLEPAQLLKVFEVFFGSQAASALATWNEIGLGPYRLREAALPMRAASRMDAVRSNQVQWLSDLLVYLLLFPDVMTTPAGLAVWAPYLDPLAPAPTSLYQVSFGGRTLSVQIGRWLGKCIDQNDAVSTQILDTFRQVLADQHPASIFGRHVIYACWNSQREELWQWMCDHLLATKQQPLVQASIAQGAVGARPAAILKLFQFLRSQSKLINKQIGSALVPWFGFEDDEYNAKEFPKILDRTIGALKRLLDPTAARATTEEDQLGDAWVAMTQEVETAVPLLTALTASPNFEIRRQAQRLAMVPEHACMNPVFVAGFNDEDPEIALGALALWIAHLPKHLEASERSRGFELVAELCRRFYSHKETYSQLLAELFYNNIRYGLSKFWTTESLQTFGPALREKEFELDDMVPKGYVPPDDYTIETLLCHVEDQRSNLADLLRTWPLKVEHWAALFEKKPGWDSLEPRYIKSFENHGAQLFQEVMRGTLLHSKAKVRVIAMSVLLAAKDSKALAQAAAELVHELGDTKPKGKVSEQEARLRPELKKAYAQFKVKQSETASVDQTSSDKGNSGVANKKTKAKAKSDGAQTVDTVKPISVRDLANYPGLTYTPLWQPVYKPMRRLTPTCLELLSSLDDYIEQHKERLLAAKPDRPEYSHIVRLEQWNSYQWPESFKQTWLTWWHETGQRIAQSADLARLVTLWLPVMSLRGIDIPESIDLSQLRALEAYNEYDVYPDPKVPSLPLPDNAEVRLLRTLKNRFVVRDVFKFLLNRFGTWNDCEYVFDMVDAINAATPPELKDCIKKALPNAYLRDYLPVHQWSIEVQCLKSEAPPRDIALRFFASGQRGFESCLRAYADGVATLGDIVHSLIRLAENPTSSDVIEYERVADIRNSLTRADRESPEEAAVRVSEWNRFYEFMTDALIESELARPADQLSEWSRLANHIGYLEGYHRFERLLLVLAAKGFRPPSQKLTDLGSQWTLLAASIFPEPGCDLEQVARRLQQLLAERKWSHEFLLQAALLAPQWSEPIGLALGWPKLVRLVEWLDCHADASYFRPEIDVAIWLSQPNRQVREQQAVAGYRTFSMFSWFQGWLKTRGARIEDNYYRGLDVKWFREIEHDATDAQWAELLQAVRILLSTKKLERFQNLIEALRGKSDRNALLAEVQNATAAVHLQPLVVFPFAKDSGANLDLIERYRALTEYRKKCRKFRDGESEQEKADHALDILAWCSGTKNQEELNWKIQLAAAYQFEEQRHFVHDDISVSLAVDDLGTPRNHVTKAGKVIKSIPATAKEHPELVAQQQTLKALQKFAKQSQDFLQEAIVRQQQFSLDQLQEMMAHPVLSKMLQSLLFTDGTHIGLYHSQSQSLVTRDASPITLPLNANLRLIHPVDLIDHGGWIVWRDWLRGRGLVQSIPQVERGQFLREYFETEHPEAKPENRDKYMFGLRFSEDKFYSELTRLGWTNHGDESSWDKDLEHANMRAHLELFGSAVAALEFSALQGPLYNLCPSSQVHLIDYSECAREAYVSALAASNPNYYDSPSAPIEATRRAIQTHLAKRGTADSNIRPDNNTIWIDGQFGTYSIDILSQEIRLLPNQIIPYTVLAPRRLPALLAAIDQLSQPETERNVLQRLKVLANT